MTRMAPEKVEGKEVKAMDKRNERQQRLFEFTPRVVQRKDPGDGEEETKELYVEGYATRFNSPTVLFELAGKEYREQIAPEAFDEAEMDDVIFNYNHQGKVIARTRNKTLELKVDDQGLFIRARLDGTEEGRHLYDEIAGGYIDRMSFAFTIREESFDKEAAMWTVRKVKRLYDVSAVDIPAYDDTSISARRAAAEAMEQEREAALDLAKRKVALKCKI